MRTLPGIAVSPGVAIGEALIVDNEGFRIPRRFVMRDAVEGELQRLNNAVDAVADQITRNRDAVTAQLGEQCGAIFSAHLQMLRDPKLLAEIEGLIRKSHYSPEYAVSQTLRRFAKVFQDLDNDYLAERAHDVVDIERSLLGKLLGERREEFSHLTAPAIILAHNLTPTETAHLDRQFVLGFATEIGGAGGHTAIVAKGLEMPAVVGMGSFLTELSGGEVIIVDGNHGLVILEPDEETIAHYRQEVEEHHSLVIQLNELRDLPAVTGDGTRINLYANIEFPREAETCLQRGADGIGLYRTEFLYLGAAVEPTEQDHYEAYAEVIRQMHGRPVVIRTLDLGADKFGRLPPEEQNPFLGLRSIRLSLRNLPLFRVQLRAIMRASVLGPVCIMFPLISTLADLRQARMVLADTIEDLAEVGIAYDPHVKVGMMVEVPAAVTMLDRFLKETDFISIGTNDLVQYALAVDRGNSLVADRYQTSDPAILRLLDQALTAARAADVPASVCGQMSGEPLYTMLLLGLGLRTLSVPPSAVPEIKKICRSVSIPKCEEVARRAMTMESANEIDTYLREELRRVAPELGTT